jgi:hypothetical protein
MSDSSRQFEFCSVCSRIYDKAASPHCPYCGSIGAAAQSQDRLNEGETTPTIGATLPQSHPPVHRSAGVTAAGLMLVSFGIFGIGLLVYAGLAHANGGAFWGWLVAPSVLLAGLATVRRWRGWRIGTGLFSWLAIAVSAIVLQMALLDLIHPTWRPHGSAMAERVLASPIEVVLALIPAAVGIFMLWSKRKEPSDDGGRAVAIAVGGVILALFAVLFGAIGIAGSVNVDFGTLAFGFFMAGLHGYAALAIFRRWKYWRAAARSAASVTMVLFVIYGIGRAGENAGEGLLGIESFVAFFGYVLWAVRQKPQSKPVPLANLEPSIQAGH